LSDKTLTFSST